MGLWPPTKWFSDEPPAPSEEAILKSVTGRFKANLQVQWQWQAVTLTYLGEYISSLTADTFCNCYPFPSDEPYFQDIDSQMYHDLVAAYDFPQGVKLSAGITNFTGEEPPFIEIGFNATTDPSTYRVMGRGYFARLSWRFE